MTQLRIFSYLPNPRIWKATIAARIAGVEVEVRGAAPNELADWLWDFDAHRLTDAERASDAHVRTGTVGFRGTSLRKTDAFLDAHPFGTVPAAFSPDGTVGIFESNSIMRAVARLGEKGAPLYGHGPYEAARIDGFLDASLVFARDTQNYLLALRGDGIDREVHARAEAALAAYLGGIDRALAPERSWIVGDSVTIADIAFVAEISLLHYERARTHVLEQASLSPILREGVTAAFPRAWSHFGRLRAHPAFAPDVEPYLAKLAAGGDTLR